jgi:hypothetical protein
MAAPADQVLIVLLSAFVGYGSKWAQDWWTARNARKKEAEALWSLHKQQFHLPLLMLDDRWRPGSPSWPTSTGGNRPSTRPGRCPVLSASSTS